MGSDNADAICAQPGGTHLLALVNVFPIRNIADEVIGSVHILRHHPDKTVPGIR